MSSSSANRSELRGLLVFPRNADSEELSKMLRDSIYSNKILNVLDDYFRTLSDSDACQLKRRNVVETTLEILRRVKIPTGRADAILNRIILDLPRYSKQNLLKLVEYCLGDFLPGDNGDYNEDNDECKGWRDLLPVLLELLENEKYIAYKDREVSGSEYKSLIVKEICNRKWNVDLLPSLAKMFSDMTLERADLRDVAISLCRAMPNLSVDKSAAFVYHALKLQGRNEGKYLLDALRRYFESSYSRAATTEDKDSPDVVGTSTTSKEVRDAENTILYHLYQAAELDYENSKNILRYLKNVSYASEYILQPFVLAVLLSLSNLYKNYVFDVLLIAITENMRCKEKRCYSAWLRHILPCPSNTIGIVTECTEDGNRDRHMVLKGLVGLAFTLMSREQKTKGNLNSSKLEQMGAEMLREVIKKRHETVPSILRELIEKIIADGASTVYYTDCLAYACRQLSTIVLDHQVLITNLLERSLLLPGTVTNRVLRAVFPLMRVSPNIRETLILILRKALYRKGIDKRRMAVTGFLEILKYSKIRSFDPMGHGLIVSLSQRHDTCARILSSSSTSTFTHVTLERNTQSTESSLEYDETLCHEILDILNKCLTYEFQVRLYMYEELYNTVSNNPEVMDLVLEMLLSHFNIYYETDECVLPPVKLDLCTDTHGADIVSREPIAELIFLMQRIHFTASSKKSLTFDKLSGILESLSKRISATKLEHLNLENGRISTEDHSKFQRKLHDVKLMISIFEALIAFEIGKYFLDQEKSFLKINDLFEGYARLADFFTQNAKVKRLDGGTSKGKKDKDKSNTATRKLGKSSQVKVMDTVMDLDTISKALSLLYSDGPSAMQPSSSESTMLRTNFRFHRYILQTCLRLVQRTNSSICNDSEDRSRRHIILYTQIAKLLYAHLLSDIKSTLIMDESTALLALECFKEICCFTCTLFSVDNANELGGFIDAILGSTYAGTPRNLDLRLQDVVFSLKTHLNSWLVEEEDEPASSKGIPVLLLEIMEQFIHRLNFHRCNLQKVLDSIKEITRTDNVRTVLVAIILRLLLRIEDYSQQYGESLNEISLELSQKLGTIDNIQVEGKEQYKIIRHDTAVDVYQALNSSIKEKLDNACWLLVRLKAEENIARIPGTRAEEAHQENAREKERTLCKQLSYVIQALHTLVNTSVDPSPCVDLTFKNLQCLYHFLGDLAKYFYTKSNGHNVAFQTIKFIQVIQLAGKPLKTAFYNLVTYVEENQNPDQNRNDNENENENDAKGKSDSHAQRNKVLKETKTIPRVVYEIEQFNKEILLLGRKTGVPLENYTKHSVTRDFRIKNTQLVEALEKMDVSLLASQNSNVVEKAVHESTSESEEERNADEAIIPSAKRARTVMDL